MKQPITVHKTVPNQRNRETVASIGKVNAASDSVTGLKANTAAEVPFVHQLFCDLQTNMEADLTVTKRNVSHPTTTGDAGELCWIKMLKKYLPQRYAVERAHVLDSRGKLSDQIDVVIFDRQYSPFMLNHNGALYVPAESVYGVLEVKPSLTASHIAYAGRKADSVRALLRTNMPIVHAGGHIPVPKPPFRILAGILSLDSPWKGGLGASFEKAIGSRSENERLDLGCCLRCGGFDVKYADTKVEAISTSNSDDALIFFFLHLVARLQALGTVPAIDVLAYSRFLDTDDGGPNED